MNDPKHPAISIVTHCYCPPGIPWYAQMLKWQFSSFCHHRPRRARIHWFVYYCTNDDETSRMVANIKSLCSEDDFSFRFLPRALSPCQLFRRSIGRDMACKESRDDVVWFTDVDYLFGDGCIDEVVSRMNRDSLLHMPKEYWINYEHNENIASKYARPHHRRGQEMLERELNNNLPGINRDDFKLKKQNVAIGGMQIIGGQFTWKNGYLRGQEKWQTPVDPSLGFRSCKCDAAFRRTNGLIPTKINIPNLYRIRHETDGRDYSMTGELIGKDAW